MLCEWLYPWLGTCWFELKRCCVWSVRCHCPFRGKNALGSLISGPSSKKAVMFSTNQDRFHKRVDLFMFMIATRANFHSFTCYFAYDQWHWPWICKWLFSFHSCILMYLFYLNALVRGPSMHSKQNMVPSWMHFIKREAAHVLMLICVVDTNAWTKIKQPRLHSHRLTSFYPCLSNKQ